jgi:hypothetical protein
MSPSRREIYVDRGVCIGISMLFANYFPRKREAVSRETGESKGVIPIIIACSHSAKPMDKGRGCCLAFNISACQPHAGRRLDV